MSSFAKNGSPAARLQRRPLAHRRRAAIKDTKVLRDELESLDQQRQKAVELYTKGKFNGDELDALNAQLRAVTPRSRRSWMRSKRRSRSSSA